MRWLVWLVVMSAFAGCSGQKEPAADEQAMDLPEGNLTVPNRPPTASLAATVNGTVASFIIIVDDADGDNVTWRLDADGDGADDRNGTASGNVTFDYAGPGNHTARLNVTDGASWTDATLIVNITLDAAPPALPGQSATGDWLGGATAVGCFGDIFGVGYPGSLEGIMYASFPIEPHTWGYAYSVAVTSPYPQDSPGFSFVDAAGDIVLGGFMSTMASGEVPVNAARGIWWTCLGADLTGTYESTPV